MRFLLCGTLAVFLPLLSVALDYCYSAEFSGVCRVMIAVPFAVLAVAHLLIIGASAVGTVAFLLWIRKVFGRDGLKEREPAAYARGKHLSNRNEDYVIKYNICYAA